MNTTPPGSLPPAQYIETIAGREHGPLETPWECAVRESGTEPTREPTVGSQIPGPAPRGRGRPSAAGRRPRGRRAVKRSRGCPA